MPEIKFVPDNVTTRAEAGENLLEVMVGAGVYIHAGCGGAGVCGKCQVKVLEGTVTDETLNKAAKDKVKPGHTLACQTFVGEHDLTIEIPDESRIRKMAVSQGEPVVKGQRIARAEIESFMLSENPRPPARKLAVQLTGPSVEDNTADLQRLTAALRAEHGADVQDVDFHVLPGLPALLREANWQATATVVSGWPCRDAAGSGGACRPDHLARVQPGAVARNLALAIDVGTTSVWVALVDAHSRAVLAEAGDYNQQISFGEDVISRIMFSARGDGLSELQKAVAGSINTLTQNVLDKAGASRDEVSFVAAAGNTTMTQLLLGIDARNIRLAPYIPAANQFPPVEACQAGMDMPRGVMLYMFPCVASYVGGDIVSGVAAYGLHKRPEMTLYMDIGTNGEIVVGNSDFMMCASCSAGPAFEGGGLEFGMRATLGAVEGFAINPDNLDEPMILTIGRTKPIGICGSGIITLLAELMQFGILLQNGKFNPDAPTQRVRQGAGGTLEYVVVWKDDAGVDSDIVITEPDVDNLVRAKGAMFSGAHTLVEHVGLTMDTIERVVITGSFGNYVNLAKAVFIGLLPDVPAERFFYMRNGSLAGARLACMDRAFLRTCEDVSRMMTHVELSEAPAYMDKYMAAQFLPHTDASLFPNVMKALQK